MDKLQIDKVKLTKVYINDKDKSGKPLIYDGRPYRKIAIQTNKQAGYLSHMIWNQDDPTLQWAVEMEVEIIIYQSRGFWNFRLPTRLDRLEIRLNELEELIRTPDGRYIKEPNEFPEEDQINANEIPF